MGRGPGTAAMVALAAGLALGACGDRRDVGHAAQRAPQSLAHMTFVDGLGLAGDAVLLAGKDEDPSVGLTLVRMPLRGGPGRIFRSPDLGSSLRILSFGGTDAVAGVTFTPDDDEQGGERSGLYGGVATGPLRELEPVTAHGPGIYVPRSVEADGDLLFVTESGPRQERVTVRRADGSAQRVDLPQNYGLTAFAGDLVAYTIADPLQRVVVRRWRTGEEVTSTRIRGDVASLDLSASGAVAVGEYRGGVVELRPGRPRRRLARSGPPPWPSVPPVYAGERLVFVDRARPFGTEQLMIANPRGRARPFGVPAPTIRMVVADPRRVLWSTGSTGDCVLVAGVQAPAATAPAAGPCPRTQITFAEGSSGPGQQYSTLRPGGLVPVVLECVTAAAPGCRGTVRLTSCEGGEGFDPTPASPAVAVPGCRGSLRVPSGLESTKPLRFTIRAGARGRLVVRLAPELDAALRRGPCCEALTIIAAAKDPDGRRWEYEADLELSRSR